MQRSKIKIVVTVIVSLFLLFTLIEGVVLRWTFFQIYF